MRQGSVKFSFLDLPLYLVKVTACTKTPQPLTISRDVQLFFPLSDFSVCSTSWMMLLSFSGLNAMISLAAATMIQNTADSRIAIVNMKNAFTILQATMLR